MRDPAVRHIFRWFVLFASVAAQAALVLAAR